LGAFTTTIAENIAGFPETNGFWDEDQRIARQLASYTALRSATLRILRELALMLPAGGLETLNNQIKDSGNVVDDMVLLSLNLLTNTRPTPVSQIKRVIEEHPELKFAPDIIRYSLESHIYIYGSENEEIKQLIELFYLHAEPSYAPH